MDPSKNFSAQQQSCLSPFSNYKISIWEKIAEDELFPCPDTIGNWEAKIG